MKKSQSKIIVLSALCVALLVLCSWISLPAAVPFTMQTFAVAFIGAFLGARRGSLAICVYILLGFIGLPVFSGFGAGLPAILGTTGGYTLGFLPFCIITGFLCRIFKKSYPALFLSMSAGLLSCYIFGTLWYTYIYLSDLKSIYSAISLCVLPFIVPDLMKISLAAFLVKKAEQFIK